MFVTMSSLFLTTAYFQEKVAERCDCYSHETAHGDGSQVDHST
jgi:hypothetical protein